MSFSGNFMPKRFGAGAVKRGSSALTPEQSDQVFARTGERYHHIAQFPLQASRRERRRRQFRPEGTR